MALPVSLVCEQCGKEFQVSPYYADRGQKYCSKKCFYDSRSSQETEVLCEQCGESFVQPEGKIERNEHNFCSWACYAEWRKGRFAGENNPTYKGGRVSHKAYNGLSEEKKDEIRHIDGSRCVRCGKTSQENGRLLSVHHVVSLRDGGSHDADNLITLCRSCHQKVHHTGIAFALPERCERMTATDSIV